MVNIPKANYHTHSVFCDGTDTPEEIVRTALQKGFTRLGFSGHMDADIHMDFDAYLAEIHRLQTVYRDRLEILCGVELDTLYDPAGIHDVQYIIGSTHFLDVDSEEPMSVDSSPEQLRRLAVEFYGGDCYRMAAAYYELEATVHERTGCDMIGHFDLITRFNDQLHFLDEDDPRYIRPALEAMEYLVKAGIPFEINCGAVNRGRKKEFYPNRRLLKALHDFGGEIVISSDAHQKELLDGAFREAAQTAVECGFTHTNILTCKENGELVFLPVTF